jgi:hypothetical protein
MQTNTNMTLEQALAKIAELERNQPRKSGPVQVTKAGDQIMVKRAAKGWPVLGTPEDFAIIFANQAAIQEECKRILDARPKPVTA